MIYPFGPCNSASTENYSVTKMVTPESRIWQELEYRYTEYEVPHSDLIINTKSATFAIDPANAIECDVYNFWRKINCDECPTSCDPGCYLLTEDELYIATDDGTLGHHGFGLDILVKFLEEGRKIDHVVAVGPIPMMRDVCKVTKEYGIPIIVSLAPLMVDGTGMCGACRITLDGEIKFACVDGPNFDGLKVDFEELMLRSRAYRYEERISVERMARQS